MFYLTYNILSLFLFVPVLFYHLYRSVSRGRPPALAQRFGRILKEELARIGNRPVIWLHAVSVGEAIAARPLLKAIRTRYPGHAIVLSTTTETGRTLAATFPEKDLCIYFPFDFLPAVRRCLNSVRPKLIIIMETEIWPNFTAEARRRHIPLILANGRISDRSFRGYLRFSWFFRHSLRLFSRLCMQSAADGERIIAIGALPERVLTAGNLKYDITSRPVPADEREALRRRYVIPADMTVLTAGSTHPGEEELVIHTYGELLKSRANLFLLLVPRHPERCNEVAALLERNSIPFRRRTELGEGKSPLFAGGEVLLVDSIGEMMGLYALSDLAFVGGSLVPTGGHNLLEPASRGVASIFGPHMTNFREIAELVLRSGAGIQVDSGKELTVACQRLLDDDALRHRLGKNGLAMMEENSGATDRHMGVIDEYLVTAAAMK
jgi:3-deoxy-D-manno-octulosonic-acid transferase